MEEKEAHKIQQRKSKTFFLRPVFKVYGDFAVKMFLMTNAVLTWQSISKKAGFQTGLMQSAP